MMTPQELDALVEKLGQYVYKNHETLVNPKQSTLRSGLAILFRAAAYGTPLLRKTAKAYGIEVSGWHETLEQIIAKTEERGSNAADAIKNTILKTKQLDELFKKNGFGDTFQDGWKKIKFAKKNPLN